MYRKQESKDTETMFEIQVYFQFGFRKISNKSM